ADSQRIPQHGAEAPVACVLGAAQSVSMGDPCLPAGGLPAPFAKLVLDRQLGAEHFASPTVMVAGQPEYRQPPLAQTRQQCQDAEAGTRNHPAPCKPEVEQVAVDHQRSGAVVEVDKKPPKACLDFGWRDAEVGVRNHNAGGGQHGHSLPAASSLYKLAA